MRRLALLVAAACLVACGDDDDAADTTDAVDETTEASPETTEPAAETTEAVPDTTEPAVETTEAPDTTEAAPETTTAATDTTATADGFTFTSPANDFTVVFPAEPTSAPQTVPLPDGRTVPIEFWIYEEGGSAVAASRLEYPSDVVTSLQGAADGAVANIGGTLTSSEPISLQGRDGIRLTADVPQGTYLSEIYLDGQVLYQLVAAVEGDATFEDPDAADFFGSFEFTEDR